MENKKNMDTSPGYACIRPMGCFRPSCFAEKRCRMDPKHPRFSTPEVFEVIPLPKTKDT